MTEEEAVRLWRKTSKELAYKTAIDWWKILRDAADDIIQVVKREASKNKVDPRYVMYLIYKDEPSWGPFVGKNYLGLHVVIEIYKIAGKPYSFLSSFTMPSIEGEARVTKAIQGVAKWAATTFVNNAWKLLTKAAQKHARGIQDIAAQTLEVDWSFKEAVSLLRTNVRLEIEKDWSFVPSLYRHIMWKLLSKLFEKKPESYKG